MEYESTYDQINEVNVISVNGSIEAIHLIPLIFEVFNKKDIKKSKSFLFDIRKLILDNTLVELLNFFDDEEAHKKYMGLNVAFLYDTQEDIYQFIENAGRNRAWNVHSSNNIGYCMDWLKINSV